MSSPVFGFPDWQQYTTWRSQMLFSGNIIVNPGNPVTTGQFPLTNFGSVRIEAGSLANGGELFLEGLDDNLGSFPVPLGTWVIHPNTQLNVCVPCPSNFVRFTITSEPALQCTIQVKVQATNIATTAPRYLSTYRILKAPNTVIAPGAFHNYYPPWVVSGVGFWWGYNVTPAAPLEFTIHTVNADRSFREFVCEFPQFGLNYIQTVQLPPHTWAVRIHNSDAVNRNYLFSLTVPD